MPCTKCKVWKPEQMKVEIKSSNISGIYLDPVSVKRRKKYDKLVIDDHRASCPDMHRDHNRDQTEAWLKRFPLILVQVDHEADQVLGDLYLSKSQRADISAGWTVTILMSVDSFDHYFSHYCKIDMGY